MATDDGEGSCHTKQLEGMIVETVYSGKIRPEMVDQVQRDLEPLLRRLGGADWLVDASRVTTLRPAPPSASSGFFTFFRAAGGRRVAVVITSAPIRMLASALAFSLSQDIKVFTSRDEALRYLRSA